MRTRSEIPKPRLRPATPGDRELLYQLYRAARDPEMAATEWSAAEKDAFLRFQFNAQDAHYRTSYPGAELSVITLDLEAIGRQYVYRTLSETRLMEITLFVAFRNLGIGTILTQQLLDEARLARKTVSLHVDPNNPASRLYARLGFRVVRDLGSCVLMEAKPE